MEQRNNQLHTEEGGYLSGQHKKTYTITVGILGAVFFLCQFVVPFIVMMVAMPTFMSSTLFSMKDADPGNGTYWQGRIWYPESPAPFDESMRKTTTLRTVDFDPLREPEAVAEVPISSPRLLAGTDRLWLITSDRVAYIMNGTLNVIDGTRTLGDFTGPFLHNGQPAVIEGRPEGLAFTVFRDGGWHEEFTFELYSGEKPCCMDDLQVISDNDKLHIFLKYGQTLFYRDGLNYVPGQGKEVWNAIAPAGSRWQALLVGGRPVLFINTVGNEPMIKGYRKNGDRWDQFVSHRQFMTSGMGTFALDDGMTIAVITQAMPGSLRILRIEGDTVTSTIRHGSKSMFPKEFMVVMMIPQSMTLLVPLILALILTVLMKTHRVVFHNAGPRRMPFASLAKRAFAQIIDALILASPLIAVWFMFMSVIFDAEDPFLLMKGGMVTMFALLAGGLSWLLVCLVAFSFMEGKWGITPGKWTLGIRVFGTDLEYCGFWRALVRNLLTFVDGFFNFLVGVLVVALSEHWQRVGDMAARTVVVDVRKG